MFLNYNRAFAIPRFSGLKSSVAIIVTVVEAVKFIFTVDIVRIDLYMIILNYIYLGNHISMEL